MAHSARHRTKRVVEPGHFRGFYARCAASCWLAKRLIYETLARGPSKTELIAVLRRLSYR